MNRDKPLSVRSKPILDRKSEPILKHAITPKPAPGIEYKIESGFVGRDIETECPLHWDTSPETRTTHLYLPGMTGSGKTSLMVRLAVDDMLSAHDPVVVIDPKGTRQGLVNRILPHLPDSLHDRVHYVSLRHPVPIDLLSYKEDPLHLDEAFLRSDIIEILRRFSVDGSWGSTMQDVLNNLIPTLLENPYATFLDIGRFLEDTDEQDRILGNVSPKSRKFWEKNRPTNDERKPLMRRMSNFKHSPFNIFVDGKRGDGLNITDIVENNEILLVDTSPPTEDGRMLAALIMAKVQQAIRRRADDQTYPICHVYLDEVHNFVSQGFKELLLQSRSYGFSLCMANPDPFDLKEIWSNILAGVHSYGIFNLDPSHAAMLAGKLHERPVNESLYDAAILEYKQQIRWWKDAVHERTKIFNQVDRDPTATSDMYNMWYESLHSARDTVHRLEDHPPKKPTPPPTFLEQIKRLPRFEMVFTTPSATHRVKTPAPLDSPYSTGVEKLKGVTYGRIVQKRTVDKFPGNKTQNVVPLEDDGNRNTKPEVVLSDDPKAGRSHKSGKVRSYDRKGSR